MDIQNKISSLMDKLPPEVSLLAEYLATRNFSLTLVGGAVRDYFLEGLIPKDLDFELRHPTRKSFDPEAFKLFIEKKYQGQVKFLPFNIVHIQYKGGTMELTPPRQEAFVSKDFFTHSDFDVKISLNLPYDEAWIRRDFTVNAMGIELDSLKFVDPFKGISDLKNKCLRPCSKKYFYYDPVRFLRFIRFQFRLNFTPEQEFKKYLSRFNLQGMSAYHFLREALKSPFFFRFILRFFSYTQQYNISIPANVEPISFLGTLNIGFRPQTPEDVLLCLIYYNARPTDKEIISFKKYAGLRESLYTKHQKFRVTLEDLFGVNKDFLLYFLEKLSLREFIELKEVRLLKHFHRFLNNPEKNISKILEKCNPNLSKTYQELKILFPKKLHGQKDFNTFMKRENLSKKHWGELQIYCHCRFITQKLRYNSILRK